MAKTAAPWSKYNIIHPEPQDNWLICGSGYLQHEGDADQGIPAAAAELEERFRGRVRVEHRRWDDDWDDLAEWIFRRCSGTENVCIMAAVYSWGGGFGFKRFAKSCAIRGMKISGAVLSDAVAHLGGRVCHHLVISQAAAFWPPPWCKTVPLPTFKKPFYYQQPLRRLRLYLPSSINKENFYWFVQENSWLRGHDIYWEDTGELAANKQIIGMRTHRYMDESPEFREKVLDVAYAMFGGERPEIPSATPRIS